MPNLYDHSRVSYRPEPQSADGTPDRCRETSPGYLTRLPWRLSLTHRGRVWGLTQDLTVMHMLPFGQIVKWGQSPTVLVLVQRPDENAASAAVTEWHFTTAQSHEVDRVLYAPPPPSPSWRAHLPSFPIRLVVGGRVHFARDAGRVSALPRGPLWLYHTGVFEGPETTNRDITCLLPWKLPQTRPYPSNTHRGGFRVSLLIGSVCGGGGASIQQAAHVRASVRACQRRCKRRCKPRRRVGASPPVCVQRQAYSHPIHCIYPSTVVCVSTVPTPSSVEAYPGPSTQPRHDACVNTLSGCYVRVWGRVHRHRCCDTRGPRNTTVSIV